MPGVGFDTLQFGETLRKNGFEEQQAKGMATALIDVQRGMTAELATKADLGALGVATKVDIGEVRAEMDELRADMAQGFKDVRAEMAQEFAAVRSEMKQEFLAVRSEAKAESLSIHGELALLCWMLVLIGGGVCSLGLQAFF